MGDEYKNTEFKVIIILSSTGPDNMVSLEVKYEPNMEGKDIPKLGFMPASYNFVEKYVVPALEEGINEWVTEPLMDWDSPSQYNN